MAATQALAFHEENLVGWERALVALLVEKECGSGSQRTVQGYSSMLQDFLGRLNKTPDRVTPQEVFVWAHGLASPASTLPLSPSALVWPASLPSFASCSA